MKTTQRPPSLVSKAYRYLFRPQPRYFCAVCNKPVEKFSPLSTVFIENRKKYGWQYEYTDFETINPEQYNCPHCGAADRDRLYALYLNKKLPAVSADKNFSLVDFAPSRPLQKYLKKSKIHYRTADLFMDNVDDRVDLMNMAIYPDNCFDAFICSHILEHVADDAKALRELYRILKPGGWGIAMSPINLVAGEIDEDPTVTDVGERWRRFGQDDHVRLYTKKGFVERIQAAGFTVHQYGVQYFGQKTFKKSGITERSVLYITEKK